MRLENYGSALADATSAIDKDPKYIKARPCTCLRCAGEGQVSDLELIWTTTE